MCDAVPLTRAVCNTLVRRLVSWISAGPGAMATPGTRIRICGPSSQAPTRVQATVSTNVLAVQSPASDALSS